MARSDSRSRQSSPGSGCVTSPGSARGASPSVRIPPALPNDVRWFRTSAEYRALARQTYQLAADRLPDLTRGAARINRAVILDADETVLDNSEYQRRRALDDSAYTEASWSAWVNEQTATAIPGAAGVYAARPRTRGTGGRRHQSVRWRSVTRRGPTSRRSASRADLVLCQPPGESNKNPRFERVQAGTAEQGFAAATIVEWIGDNILDFPV